MARDFDGANDKIDCGSDASIDGFASKTIAIWVRSDETSGDFDALVSKGMGPGWQLGVYGTNEFAFLQGWSSVDGNWETPAQAANALLHFVATYNGGATGNDPVLYVNGSPVTASEVGSPAGTIDTDAAQSLIMGEAADGSNDFDGLLAFVCYDNTIWDAAMVNRHKWWGCAPGGPSTVKVWLPFLTSDLNNKGTATANGTATGTTMNNTAMPRVERMWGSMMGVGR